MGFIKVDKIERSTGKIKERIKQEIQSLVFSLNFPFRKNCVSI